MERSLADRFVDMVIAGIAVFGWCVVAPLTALGCELFDLVERLRIEWRALCASLGGDAS